MEWHRFERRVSDIGRTLRSLLTVLGLVLVLFGVLIVLMPKLLQFLVGGVFILVGVSVLAAAWGRRRPPQRRYEPGEEPDVIDDWR
jgi:membrane protein required for beta-lactamase induction